MEYYTDTLLQMEKICKTFKKLIINKFFKSPDAMRAHLFYGTFCFFPKYQKGYFESIKGVVRVIELFGIDILERNKGILTNIITGLETPSYVMNREAFETHMNNLIELFSDKSIKKQVKDRLSILSLEEELRLDEAIHCFLQGCNYSAVAMSVSAIEFRLLSLMTAVSPAPRLEKMTLGQLINEYLNNKEKYRNVIPTKYEKLLEHCNAYRIFSVHPKREKINKSVATSILHMTFQFLLDKKLVKKVKT